MAFITDPNVKRKLDEELQHKPLAAEAAYKECKNTNVIFSWRIVNYSQLRYRVLYFRLFENTDFKCVFKMLKTRKALYVCLRSEQISHKSAQFHIDDETEYASLITCARELMNGLYVGDFIHQLFLPGYLKDDILTVSFRYNDSSQPAVTPIFPQQPDCIEDLNEFCSDMKYMYLASLHSDFTICAGDYTFDVHKFVLASRSKFFEEFFSENGTAEEYSLDSPPRIVHMMLVYVYSGEIKKLEMASMVEMYDLARELRIDNLLKKCLCFISESINDWNCQNLLSLANTLNCPELKKIVNQYDRKRKIDKKRGSFC